MLLCESAACEPSSPFEPAIARTPGYALHQSFTVHGATHVQAALVVCSVSRSVSRCANWGIEGVRHEAYAMADEMLLEPDSTAQPETAAEPDGWVAWGGGDCPVAPDIVVEVHLADDYFSTDKAIVFDWTHDCDDRNIIAYRVVQP